MAEAGSDPGSYIFNRDHKASIRLNYQHMLIKSLCNEELLHQTVRRSISLLPSPLRVADIGTGTAIWLTELAEALPADSQLYGFDVSRDQYPHKEWLPENVSLHEHDAFAPFADEFLGSFDVVNIRFFITLLNEGNIQTLLNNLKTLLKPGGFLHWLDLDPRSARPICARPNTLMPRTENVATLMRKVPADLDIWFSNGGDLLKEVGLDHITCEPIQLRNHLRPLWNDCYIMGMEELARRMSANASGHGDKASPLVQQIEALGAELAQGTSIDVQWFLAVGQMTVK